MIFKFLIDVFSSLDTKNICLRDCNPYRAPALSEAKIEILLLSILSS